MWPGLLAEVSVFVCALAQNMARLWAHPDTRAAIRQSSNSHAETSYSLSGVFAATLQIHTKGFLSNISPHDVNYVYYLNMNDYLYLRQRVFTFEFVFYIQEYKYSSSKFLE